MTPTSLVYYYQTSKKFWRTSRANTEGADMTNTGLPTANEVKLGAPMDVG